jgi:hypothetical protein
LSEDACQETVQRELLRKAAVLAVAFASLGWLGLSLLCLGMGFESSEYEKSDARWWHDIQSCMPIWLAFIGFTSTSAIALYYRKNGIALLVSLASIWTLFHR